MAKTAIMSHRAAKKGVVRRDDKGGEHEATPLSLIRLMLMKLEDEAICPG